MRVHALYGQSDSATHAFIKSTFKPLVFSLTPEKKDLNVVSAYPFREIEVLDRRPDTSRIGFFYDRPHGHRELFLQTGVRSTVQSFVNDGFANPSASKSLLVVIKKLWVSEFTPVEPDKAFTGKPHTTAISFRAESYLKVNTGYLPFALLDTTITTTIPVIQTPDFALPELFTAFMKKMTGLDIEKALRTKRTVSMAFIDSFNNRKLNYAMMNPGQLQKGVYATVEDFRNNKPSISDYVIEEEKGDLSLYLKDEQGKAFFTRKIWGYCDGHGVYAMINGNLYPVLRQQNAFYVFGARDYVIKTTRIPIFTLFPATYIGSVAVSQKVVMKLRMFALDPHTGEME